MTEKVLELKDPIMKTHQSAPAAAQKPTVSQPVRVLPEEVHEVMSQHMLVDGFDLVVDLKRSQGTYLYDSRYNKRYLDFFTFFASGSVGMNHPKMTTPDFLERLAWAGVNKPSNSDAYSTEMAEFVETFARVAMPDYFKYVFFIDGGALAVENAVKAAFDWKVRKNFIKGHLEETGSKIIHFRHAFHGRSGYTLSLTNTDPTKTNYYPKFKWPRIHNPVISFPLNEENILKAEKEEQLAINQIKHAIFKDADDIAALIIEPIQGEGGDNHFRREFLQELRTICDENDILLIFDEVQTGLGITGKMWAHEYFVKPDLMSFGKKTQICGFMATDRLDEVRENVFRKSSRINSTFGGNLVDMVRCQRILEIISEENLVENAAQVGGHLLNRMGELQNEFPGMISNSRGRGLFCAMDLASSQARDQLRLKAYDEGLILIGCGDRSIRFRPPLNVTVSEINDGFTIIRKAVREIVAGE